jgi:hypothetical protein
MSQTKAQLVSGTTAQDLTVDNINTTSVNSSQLSNRNKIINGEAQISQRGTISNHGTAVLYTAVDRFATRIGSSFNFDVTTSRSTDAPAGFYNSLKLTPDSTQTPSGSQNGGFQQRIEGQNIQDFGFGTSSAKPITLSFYAKSGSSGAGTYSLDIRARKVDGNDYIQTRAFTVTSSWQRFTFTCEANGLATSESLINNNTTGFVIIWHLASGPDDQEAAKTTWVADGSMKTVSGMSNFMSATANEFYITGVQLEVGSTATDFEHRSFAVEKRLCDRYYQKIINTASSRPFGVGNIDGSTQAQIYVSLPVEMRTAPSSMELANNSTDFQMRVRSSVTCTGHNFFGAGPTNVFLEIQVSTGHGFTDGQAAFAINNGPNLFMGFSAEL